MHFDVSVAREQAENRLIAALAAGGRIVDESSAPASWILADRAGKPRLHRRVARRRPRTSSGRR
jgi:hypothetical protein